MFMTIHDFLILKTSSKYSLPEFNSKIKFTSVMEEVLYTLIVFFILSGESVFTNVVSDLIDVLDRSPNAIGSALKALDQLNLLAYYQDGKFRAVELHLENDFLKSITARFFGITNFTKMKCKKLKQILLGFYPILDYERTMAMFQSETERLDLLVDNHQHMFDWVNKIENLEKLAKTTHSTDDYVDDNPILLFIDKVVSAIQFKQMQQTADPTFQELSEIVSEIVSELQEIPPWVEDAVSGRYNPWADFEEGLL